MKILCYMTLLLALVIPFPLMAANDEACDKSCRQERIYELEQQHLKNEQDFYQKILDLKEKQYQDYLKREHNNLRIQRLNEAKARCDKENMNDVSSNERSLCNAINGYFSYGIPVSDAMLGISG